MRKFLQLIGMTVLACMLTSSEVFAQGAFVRLWNNYNTGTLDADDDEVAIMNAGTMAIAGVQVVGTFTGDIDALCTLDGTNYITLNTTEKATGAAATPITTEGIFTIDITGCRSIKMIADNWVSGAAVVSINTIHTGGGGGSSGGGLTDAELRADPVEVSVVTGGTTQVTSGASGGTVGTLGMGIWDDGVTSDSVTDTQNARVRLGPYGQWVGAIIVDPTTLEAADLTPEPCTVRANILQKNVTNASTGNYEIVEPGASQRIYPCGYYLISDGTVSLQWVYGDDSDCATNETDLSRAHPMVASSGWVEDLPKWFVPTGKTLCLEYSGNVGAGGIFTYQLVTP